MEVIINGNSFFTETSLSSVLDCTLDCATFCVDCSFGF